MAPAWKCPNPISEGFFHGEQTMLPDPKTRLDGEAFQAVARLNQIQRKAYTEKAAIVPAGVRGWRKILRAHQKER